MRLLESSAPRRRTRGGTVLSILVHVVVVGAATVVTAHAGIPSDPDDAHADVLHYVEPAPPGPTPPSVERPRTGPAIAPTAPTAPTLPVVDAVPNVIPPPAAVDPLRGLGESFERGLRGATHDGAGHSGVGSIPIGDAPLDARYVDKQAEPLGTIRPRYPEMLRAAGVSGRAVVRFVVDTLGHVEPGSAELVSATHPAFGDAALHALPSLRFRPAEAGGRRVRQLVQLPFEFVIE